MNINDILTWLSSAPQLGGETLNWNYLPSYSGWSLTIPKAETKTDILGNTRTLIQVKITRRYTIQSNADRLAVVEALEDLADWARANPLVLEAGLPDERPQAPCKRATVRRTALSESQFTSRNNSGTEDISITLTIEESDYHS